MFRKSELLHNIYIADTANALNINAKTVSTLTLNI